MLLKREIFSDTFIVCAVKKTYSDNHAAELYEKKTTTFSICVDWGREGKLGVINLKRILIEPLKIQVLNFPIGKNNTMALCTRYNTPYSSRLRKTCPSPWVRS
jgi:hypothetical protein